MNLGDILVIAPHPDDETLGAGGTLLRAKAAGHRIHWLLLTVAAVERWSADYIHTQRTQVDAVKVAFGFDSFHWWDVPASGLAQADFGKMVDRLRQLLAETKPATLIFPHVGDAHDDHAVAFAMATAAAKAFRMRSFGVRRLMAMDILSETDAAPPLSSRAFLPNVGIDIGPHLARKIEIFRLYESEHVSGSPRTPEIVEAHARVCGSTFGVAAAERFMLIRELI